LIAPDQITFDYLRGRPLAPKGAEWDAAVAYWKSMCSDADAAYDVTVDIKAEDIAPTVSWGTSPQDVVPITGSVPDPASLGDAEKRKAVERALDYMGLAPNTPMQQVAVDKVR
jgi:3-isopropylmalate dehydratase